MAHIKQIFRNIYDEEAYLMTNHTVELDDGTAYATSSEQEAIEKIRAMGYR